MPSPITCPSVNGAPVICNVSHELRSFIQLLSAWLGIFGSLFFAIGVVRRSTEAMARLSGSYYDPDPHMPRVLSAKSRDLEGPE